MHLKVQVVLHSCKIYKKSTTHNRTQNNEKKKKKTRHSPLNNKHTDTPAKS